MNASHQHTVILETRSCPPMLGAARDNAFLIGACRGGVLAHPLAFMLNKPSVGMQRYLFSTTSCLNLSLFCSHTPRQQERAKKLHISSSRSSSNVFRNQWLQSHLALTSTSLSSNAVAIPQSTDAAPLHREAVPMHSAYRKSRTESSTARHIHSADFSTLAASRF